jgi:predicted lysophospholipase L1 biosynthesis ABC-type transport system permease subunit
MTTNWKEQNKALFHALNMERLVTYITVGLIVFVAALNILISLIMMVMEKTKDIAVLMSMGTRKAQVRNIFIAQGVLIGVIGTAIGLLLGYAISYAGGHYHMISLSPEVYSIDYVPFAPRLTGWFMGRAGSRRSFVHRDALSVMVGRQNSAGGSVALRIILSGAFAVANARAQCAVEGSLSRSSQELCEASFIYSVTDFPHSAILTPVQYAWNFLQAAVVQLNRKN